VGFVEVKFWEEIRIVSLVSTLGKTSGVRGFHGTLRAETNDFNRSCDAQTKEIMLVLANSRLLLPFETPR
jgi:hypothetical protein